MVPAVVPGVDADDLARERQRRASAAARARVAGAATGGSAYALAVPQPVAASRDGSGQGRDSARAPCREGGPTTAASVVRPVCTGTGAKQRITQAVMSDFR